MGRRWSLPKIGPIGQFALIAGTFLLSFVTFDILFNATEQNGYFQNIIAALIGTILAAVVTAMLLTSQSRGEELKDRNVEVFRKKVEVYDQFLDQALAATADRALDDEEVQSLRRSVYRLSLFSSEATVTTVAGYVRNLYVQDSNYDLDDVVSAFRQDLSLENIDALASVDLSVVDNFLHAPNRAGMDQTRSLLEASGDALADRLLAQEPKLFEGTEKSAPEGIGSGLGVTFACPSGCEWMLSLDYPENDEADRSLIEVFADLTDMSAEAAATVRAQAISLGFEPDANGSEEFPETLLHPDPAVATGGEHEGRRVWTNLELADAIAMLERLAQTTAHSSKKRKFGL